MAETQRRGMVLAGIWLAALLIVLHPVTSENLWWELSKGRAVMNGSLHPTADLIAGTTGADADWLSGVIPYLLMSTFGVSGLMGLQIAIGLGLTWLFVRRSAELPSGKQGATAGAAVLAMLVAMHASGSPGPLQADVVCLTALWLATEGQKKNRDVASIGLILALLVVWANLGPRVCLGVLVAGPALWPRPGQLIPRLGTIPAILCCASLTPAGCMTLVHSLIQTWPPVAEPIVSLRAAGWHPWWSDLGSSGSLAFLVLSATSLMTTGPRPPARILLVFAATQLLACFSAENLPLAAVWLGLAATAPGPQSIAARGLQSRTSQSGPGKKEPTAAVDRPDKVGVLSIAYIGVFLWTCWVATHPWSNSESTIGWGLDPRLNPEAFAASLADTTVTGNAHCVGWREAGLLSWYAGTDLQPFDTPKSALLNHRLREHVLLTSDLTHRWQTPHPRPDGDWGGWWQSTQATDIQVLVVPSENLPLVTALEPTIWKPLSLSSTSLVYGKAGDPGVTPQIVQTLSLRQIVDRGTWTYQSAGESASDLTEFFAWPGNSTAFHQSLRLARSFRAMEMHIAALKVLHGMPGRNRSETRTEFFANQLALGYQERIFGGRSSEFRLQTCLRNDQFAATDVLNRLNWPLQTFVAEDSDLADALRMYASGERAAALAKLSENHPETVYARGLLLLESGQPEAAGQTFRELMNRTADRRLSILAQRWSESLGQ